MAEGAGHHCSWFAVEAAFEGLELLDEGECLRLLATREVGRVGVTTGSLPAIFPVNYR